MSAECSDCMRPVTRCRVCRTSPCTRSSTAGRSRPASRRPTVAGTSSRAASWGSSTRCSPRTTCARSPGELAIGHVRYSTTGSNAWENSQPVQRSEGTDGSRREVALAHNGNLINAVELHDELLERGVSFSSTSDSEIIAALIATHPAELLEDADRRRAAAAARRLLDRGDDARTGWSPSATRTACARSCSARSSRGADDRRGRRCATAWPASPARSTSSAPSYLRDVEPGEVVTLGERGPSEPHGVARAAGARSACSSTSTSRARTRA